MRGLLLIQGIALVAIGAAKAQRPPSPPPAGPTYPPLFESANVEGESESTNTR